MNAKSCKILMVLALIGLFITGSNVMAGSHGEVQNGIYSISQFPNNKLLKLDGNWEFYWDELYTPEDFRGDTFQQSPQIVDVPNTWSTYILGGENLPTSRLNQSGQGPVSGGSMRFPN